jgi:sporulation protein YlmC with PRC-barrel domain
MAQLPTQSQFGDYSDWPGRDVLDSGGQRLGGVREIYLDRETGQPEWVLVDLDDAEARFVPLANADIESQSIKVAHPADKIRSAPGIGAEPRIDQSEERKLYGYYGLGYSEDESGTGLPTDDGPAPEGRRGDGEEPARGGSATDEPAAFSAPDGGSWSSAGGPTNQAPPPAEPPSAAELETAHIPDGPPAASDRGAEYETAPFGAVSPPSSTEEPASVSAFGSAPDEDTTAPSDEEADTPASPALSPHAAAPVEPPAPAVSPAEAGDTSARQDDALAPPVDGPSSLTPPSITAGADTPPITADTPEAADTPTWASSPPPSPDAGQGALERVKRSPKRIAIAASAAAVLFFIVRKLR